ncbi:MAG: archaetidylserine decarboxylase [Coxiella endosymbiont of Haemaphysalis qinghaiensis]
MCKLRKYLPRHTLSRIVGWFADRQWSSITRAVIRLFIGYYGVNMQEAKNADIHSYSSFNAFFTRHLNSALRPITSDSNAVASPVDGVISEIGELKGETILQAKKHCYIVTDLLGGNSEQAKSFQEGAYFTAYLAPKDYHRIHMPIDGDLLEMTYIPGRLFSVNPFLVQTIPRLFARNERVVCLFKTQVGLMAVVIVGAILVGSIKTVWHGTVTPNTQRAISVWNYRDKNINLTQGDELGHFEMGSTVILLFPFHGVRWEPHWQTNSRIFFGEKIGTLIT